jgi:hypothetical protein
MLSYAKARTFRTFVQSDNSICIKEFISCFSLSIREIHVLNECIYLYRHAMYYLGMLFTCLNEAFFHTLTCLVGVSCPHSPSRSSSRRSLRRRRYWTVNPLKQVQSWFWKHEEQMFWTTNISFPPLRRFLPSSYCRWSAFIFWDAAVIRGRWMIFIRRQHLLLAQ